MAFRNLPVDRRARLLPEDVTSPESLLITGRTYTLPVRLGDGGTGNRQLWHTRPNCTAFCCRCKCGTDASFDYIYKAYG